MNQTTKKMNTTNNTHQVNGTHYKFDMEPVQIMAHFHLDWFQGEVLKYASRHWNKNGHMDLKKALHVIDMAKDLHTIPRVKLALVDLDHPHQLVEDYVKQFEQYYKGEIYVFRSFLYDLINYNIQSIRSSLTFQIRMFYTHDKE